MPINPNSPTIAKKLNQALLITSSVLSEMQRQDIQIYINAGEWLLGLDTLCEFLYEDELPITPEAYKILKEVEALIDFNLNIVGDLKTNLVN